MNAQAGAFLPLGAEAPVAGLGLLASTPTAPPTNAMPPLLVTVGIVSPTGAQPVLHRIAKQFFVPEVELRPESGGSRDFHGCGASGSGAAPRRAG